jgi:hypothetical protein
MSSRFPLFLLPIAALLLGVLAVPLAPPVVGAQPVETPILGEPVVVTPLISAVPEPYETAAPSTASPAPSTSVGTPPETTSGPAPATPDACEANDTPAQACQLPLDTISGPFTFVPDSDQDFYRLDLPEEASIQTVITARATAGLDLVLSARQGEQLVASGTISLTLAPAVAGPVTLRVENRDPRPAAGEQYRIEVRREIVPPSQGEEAERTGEPDALENNWSFETAAPIAVGVVYDLTLVCPETRPGACPGGDHDYLLVPIKAGVSYRIATFDLDPGVDTVIELFWASTTTATAGNDDYAPGGPLSALDWTAPGDGILGVRIAPRYGGLNQHVSEPKASYRFAVAPLASELARKLETLIRQQANVPTPAPTVAPVTAPPPSAAGGSGGSSPAPAPPAGGTISQETITAGPAIIVTETVLRREPNERSTALATLAPETLVSVRGPVSGLWVSVESAASILPGWVRFSDVRRVDAATAGTNGSPTGTDTTPTPQQTGAANQPNVTPTTTVVGAANSPAASGVQVAARTLDLALSPPPPPPVARVPFAVSVIVVATDNPPMGGATLGFATPTPDMRQPVARVRVQLVNVFGDLLAEGLTDVAGSAQLRRDIRPGDSLRVRIPAWGVELPLAPEQTSLVVTIPEGQ